MYDEYWGTVDDASNARAVAKAIGEANVGLLANHGVVVLEADIQQAYLRAMSFEWRAVAKRGALPPQVVVSPSIATRRAPTVTFINSNKFTGLFEAMVRRELRVDPTVLN